MRTSSDLWETCALSRLSTAKLVYIHKDLCIFSLQILLFYQKNTLHLFAFMLQKTDNILINNQLKQKSS